MELFNPTLEKNATYVRPAYFMISGFIGIPNVRYYFVFLCFIYIFSVLGNTMVMTVIILDRALRAPKYIAVFNLALVDLLSSSALVPKVLDIFLLNHRYIPYNDCLTFMFFCYTFLTMQSLNLVALCYDRLIAIYYPLHYHTKVTHRVMLNIIVVFWLLDIFLAMLAVGLLTRLSFCKSVVINSYFCDHGPVYRLACNDYTPNLVISFFLPVLILYLPLLFILVSYYCIGYALSKISTVQERVRAFKTCTGHLSLVAIYYFPLIFVYLFGTTIHPNARIITLSLNTVIPPMLNPFIYVFQTREIKESLKKLLKIRGKAKISTTN
ncbi:olfactory receptor 1E16-like [Embiotoca jacksoni]|uniref:olfactory receptor 1E16-like n=1 Tax=Embiotoca jacksoni TaxID=100190 RepID=UPI003704BF0C